MPGALEKTDLRPNLDPWVHRDGVATRRRTLYISASAKSVTFASAILR